MHFAGTPCKRYGHNDVLFSKLSKQTQMKFPSPTMGLYGDECVYPNVRVRLRVSVCIFVLSVRVHVREQPLSLLK